LLDEVGAQSGSRRALADKFNDAALRAKRLIARAVGGEESDVSPARNSHS
jgi:hypothetical protein